MAKLEFYVLNYDFNKKKVVNFNIFSNWLFEESALNDARKYRDGEIKDYEEYVNAIRKDLMWQEWSRRQYEISVGDAFETDISKFEKWDCYAQALPNIKIIARLAFEYVLVEDATDN